MLTLIDSSVWIEVGRGRAEPALVNRTQELLPTGRAVLCDSVWLELFHGAKGKREIATLNSLKELSRWVAFDEGCWEHASRLGRVARAHGLGVPLGDRLIFACARRRRLHLLHRDRHLERLETLVETAK